MKIIEEGTAPSADGRQKRNQNGRRIFFVSLNMIILESLNCQTPPQVRKAAMLVIRALILQVPVLQTDAAVSSSVVSDPPSDSSSSSSFSNSGFPGSEGVGSCFTGNSSGQQLHMSGE